MDERDTGWLDSWRQRALQERDLRERISSHLFPDDDDQGSQLWSWLPAVACTAVILAGMGVAVWVFFITAPTTTPRALPQPAPTGMGGVLPLPLPLRPERVGADELTRGEIRQPSVQDSPNSLRRLPVEEVPSAAPVRPTPEARPPAPGGDAPSQKRRIPADRDTERPKEKERPREKKPEERPTLELEVVDEPVEVTVRDERGNVLVSGLQQVGWRQSFDAPAVELEVADRRKVKIWVDGKRLKGDGTGPFRQRFGRDEPATPGEDEGAPSVSDDDASFAAQALPPLHPEPTP